MTNVLNGENAMEELSWGGWGGTVAEGRDGESLLGGGDEVWDFAPAEFTMRVALGPRERLVAVEAQR